MHPALRSALDVVLADLDSARLPRPVVREHDWSDVPDQCTAMLVSPDGSAMGVSVMTSESVASRIADAADQVQEWLIEEHWRSGAPTDWPPCPRHPTAHPLSASATDGVARWICPLDGRPVAVVGRLAEAD